MIIAGTICQENITDNESFDELDTNDHFIFTERNNPIFTISDNGDVCINPQNKI